MTRYTPTPFVGQLESLPLYILQELTRIADSIASVQGGGTLYRASPVAAPIRSAPAGGGYVQIIDFDRTAPERGPVGINLDLLTNSIHLRRGGLWGVGLTLDCTDLAFAREYEVKVFVNDTPTGLFTQCDLSNQTAAFVFNLTGVFRIGTDPYGDFRVDLRMRSLDGIAAPFRVRGGYFCVWAIGD